MNILSEKIKLSKSVYGENIVDYYKKNTLFMYDLYGKSSEYCPSIKADEIYLGGFYHLHYKDDSNWMKWSPIFCCDLRDVGGMKLILGLNLNFIPLDIRVSIFENFITEEDFRLNKTLKVDFMGMYKQLLKFGFEYAIQEYNLNRVVLAHRIHLDILPRFFYSSHPKNIYDPGKLYQIWSKKLETRELRHAELIQSTLDEFYDINNEISEKYNVLTNRITRIRKNFEKWG
jgi:hypothetical protein